jgi:hypothetical protein
MSHPLNSATHEEIKLELNRLFYFAEKGTLDREAVSNKFFWSLNDASRNWMLLQIEEYTGLLTDKKCTAIKVWKSVDYENEWDVYFHIEAQGKSVSEFALKTYVVFPKNDVCQFKLEDWSDGTRGFTNGKVVASGGMYQCVVAPTQQNVPRMKYEYVRQDSRVQT